MPTESSVNEVITQLIWQVAAEEYRKLSNGETSENEIWQQIIRAVLEVSGHVDMLSALEALGVKPDGYCFCRHNPDVTGHAGECLFACSAIAKARGHDVSDDLGATFRTGSYDCPTCGKTNDAHTKAAGDSGGPDIDSWMICYYCENWYRFDADMVPRRLTEQEEIEINLSPEAMRAMYTLKAVKAESDA